MGRPSSYSPDIAQSICDKIACGANLTKLCALENMPDVTTIYRWLREKPDFYQIYTLARENRAEIRNERIDDYKRSVLNGDIPPDVARVVIDAEKWQAAKENPRRYGDKVTLAGDAENPLTMLALRLDSAVQRRTMIDVTPDDASDLL